MKKSRVKNVLMATAVLATIVGTTGITTPVMAQAATEATTSTTDNKTTTDYLVRSIHMPSTTVMINGKVSHPLQYSKAPASFTFDQINDSDYMAHANLPASLDLSSAIDTLNDPLKITKGETVAEFSAAEMGMSVDDLQAYYQDTAYYYAWVVSRQAKYMTQTPPDFATARADYENTLLKYANENFKSDSMKQLAISMGTPNGSTGFYANEQYYNDYVEGLEKAKDIEGQGINFIYYLGLQDYLDDLSDVNPENSAKYAAQMLDKPVTDFITDQGDGTYMMDLSMEMPYAFVVGDLPKTPDTDDNGGQTTPPVNDVAAPVTVRYVDEKGKSLAKDQTLNGHIGETYTTKAATIKGYQLVKTTGSETGAFTSLGQTVTYVYAPVQTGEAGATISTVAPKGSVVYATKKIGLYSQKNFTTKSRKQWYQSKARINRPMFVVKGYAKSSKGNQRYQVKDVNHHSKTYGMKGYITANAKYTTPVYYAKKAKSITVINPNGVNAYTKKSLTGKTKHYRQGQVLKVKKIVRHHLTTRFVLSNGQYVTANKKLVQTGRHTVTKQIRVQKGINRYQKVTLTKKNGHFKKGQILTVKNWDYSHAHNFAKKDTLRYRVSGGYVTANRNFVKVVR